MKFDSYSFRFGTDKQNLTSDEVVLYTECQCHNFGNDGGYAVCCVECKDAKPDCLARREHNKNLKTKP